MGAPQPSVIASPDRVPHPWASPRPQDPAPPGPPLHTWATAAPTGRRTHGVRTMTRAPSRLCFRGRGTSTAASPPSSLAASVVAWTAPIVAAVVAPITRLVAPIPTPVITRLVASHLAVARMVSRNVAWRPPHEDVRPDAIVVHHQPIKQHGPRLIDGLRIHRTGLIDGLRVNGVRLVSDAHPRCGCRDRAAAEHQTRATRQQRSLHPSRKRRHGTSPCKRARPRRLAAPVGSP
jgi:hypothetical protein